MALVGSGLAAFFFNFLDEMAPIYVSAPVKEVNPKTLLTSPTSLLLSYIVVLLPLITLSIVKVLTETDSLRFVFQRQVSMSNFCMMRRRKYYVPSSQALCIPFTGIEYLLLSSEFLTSAFSGFENMGCVPN